ncbi:MAG: SDR family oxidoreductase [Gemmatimonadota bacterium]
MHANRDNHLAHASGGVLVTGASGALGRLVLQQWAACESPPAIAVLVRSRARWLELSSRLRIPSDVTILDGDVTQPGLGLTKASRAWVAQSTSAVVHLAADTTFSRPLDLARSVNRDGTRHLLDVIADCPHVTRLAHVSTAFVAGRRTGRIVEAAEGASTADIGWVNAYEQSKTEAEALVRAARRDVVILRSSTVACDDASGVVTQRNVIHRALRLFHDGFAAMIPGGAGSTLDVVTADYVADGIARIALRDAVDGETVHLCAGAGAIPLSELLDESYARWSQDINWRRRGIAAPSLGDLATWELFASAIEETGHARLRQVTQALSFFLPQLGLPKEFVTARATELLGAPAPQVREYWGRMIDHLEATSWRGVAGLSEVAA